MTTNFLELENVDDLLICNTCKGKKVIITDIGKIDICPKCLGSGTLAKEIEETKISGNKGNVKILLG